MLTQKLQREKAKNKKEHKKGCKTASQGIFESISVSRRQELVCKNCFKMAFNSIDAS